MQSWILAFVVILAAGPVSAVERVVPPIPGLDQVVKPVVPLDRPWPLADNPAIAPRDVPAIPAPFAVNAVNVIPPIPGPERPLVARSPLVGEWEAPLAVAPRGLPPIPALGLASLAPAQPAPMPAKLAPRGEFDPQGTVHIVAEGDTLWDISNLYLGTPWIWPSIWQDNEAVENPHLIFPGDKIWVSASEMRKLTDEEAAALMAESADAPAAMAEDMPSVPMPEAPRDTFHYVRNGSLGLVSEDSLADLAQVVGTTEEQVFLAQGSTVFVSLGEEEVMPGEHFTLFRAGEKVYDPATHKALGVHTEVVGWLEIMRVHGENARAVVRQSYVDFVPGVYLRPRVPASVEIVIQDSPPDVEGQIADLLVYQKYRGNGDVVVLNRGSQHGLKPGSTLEVYRPVNGNWKEVWYGEQPRVEIPHEPVGELVVLSVEPRTAMAYVMKATTELWYGDRFRTVSGPSIHHADAGYVTVEQRVVRWVIEQGRRAAGEAQEVATRVADEAQAMATQVPKPDVQMPAKPAALSGWNMPRLALPDLEALEGYDPR